MNDSSYARDGVEARLLIVDDDLRIRSSLVRALSLVGYYAEEAASGEEALALLELRSYDLLILDMHMPDVDGLEVMRWASNMQPELLIIVLTGNPTLESAITAIKSEVTDYLLKPISIHKIITAVTRALQKRDAEKEHLAHLMSEVLGELDNSEPLQDLPRTSDLEASRSLLIVSPLKLDRTNRLVTFIDDLTRTIELTRGETAILGSLMAHPDQVLSCRQLMQIAWGYAIDKSEAGSVIRPCISRLRRKIEDNPQKPCLIRTVRRRGYIFVSSKQ